MSIPRRRRRSIRTVIADLQSAIADLDARVDALEEEDEWLLEEPVPSRGNIGIGTNADGNIGVGTSQPLTPGTPEYEAVKQRQEAKQEQLNQELLAFLAKQNAQQSINTSMSEGNVGIGSTATDGNIGVGTSSGNVGGSAPEANVGIGSTGTDGNVGVGSSADGNVGVGT